MRNYTKIIFGLFVITSLILSIVIIVPALRDHIAPHGAPLYQSGTPVACNLQAQEPELLSLPGINTKTGSIEFNRLPVIKGKHSLISRAVIHDKNANSIKYGPTYKQQNHAYLTHFNGEFWMSWTYGPPVEAMPTAHVLYATSQDGLNWSAPKKVFSPPKAPYANIARGFWQYEGNLYLLSANFKAPGVFSKRERITDKELKLALYKWSDQDQKWHFENNIIEDGLNNFSPIKISEDSWAMTLRDDNRNVSVAKFHGDDLTHWERHHVVDELKVENFLPDEPILFNQTDKNLHLFFRDNKLSNRLFYAGSKDSGQTWTQPVKSNFTSSYSKFFILKTSKPLYLMVLNGNPEAIRKEMHIAISRDGLCYNRLAKLDIPTNFVADTPLSLSFWRQRYLKFKRRSNHIMYPHAVEHNNHIYIAFSRNKTQMEMFKVDLNDLDALLNK